MKKDIVRRYKMLMKRKGKGDKFYYEMEKILMDKDSFNLVAREAYHELYEWSRKYGPLQFVTASFDPIFTVVSNPHVRSIAIGIKRNGKKFFATITERLTGPIKGTPKEQMGVLKGDSLKDVLEKVGEFLKKLDGITFHSITSMDGKVSLSRMFTTPAYAMRRLKQSIRASNPKFGR